MSSTEIKGAERSLHSFVFYSVRFGGPLQCLEERRNRARLPLRDNYCGCGVCRVHQTAELCRSFGRLERVSKELMGV